MTDQPLNSIDIPWSSTDFDISDPALLSSVQGATENISGIETVKIFLISDRRAVVRVATSSTIAELYLMMSDVFGTEFKLQHESTDDRESGRLSVVQKCKLPLAASPMVDRGDVLTTPNDIQSSGATGIGHKLTSGLSKIQLIDRSEDQISRWNRKTSLVASLLALLVWYLLPPAFNFKAIPWGVDQWGHLTRLEVLRNSVATDLSIPQWLPHWYSGQDIWQYYPPLAYFVLLPTSLISGNALDGYAMALTPLSAIMAVGLLWALRPWLGLFGGVAAALVFTLAPVTLWPFYGVGHVPWGVQQVILVFNIGLLLRALNSPNKTNLFLYGLTVALMIPTHSMLALMTIMATVPLTIGLWIGRFTSYKAVSITGTAGVLGAGIAAVWMIPGVTHIDLAEVPSLAIDKVFLWSGSSWFANRDAAMEFIDVTGRVPTRYIGGSLPILGTIGAILGILSPRYRSLAMGFGFMAIATFVVGQGDRTPFWEFVPLGESLLPNRSFNLMVLALAVLTLIGVRSAWPYSSIVLNGIRGRTTRINLAGVIAILALVGLAFDYSPWWEDRAPSAFLGDSILEDLAQEDESIWAVGRYWDITPVNDSYQHYSVSVEANRMSAIGWANEGTLHFDEFSLTGDELRAGRAEGLVRRADIYNAEYVWLESAFEPIVEAFDQAGYQTVEDSAGRVLKRRSEPHGYVLDIDRSVLAIGAEAPLLAAVFPNVSLGSNPNLGDYPDDFLNEFSTVVLAAPTLNDSPEKIEEWIDQRLQQGQRVVVDLRTRGIEQALDIDLEPINLVGTPELISSESSASTIGPFDPDGGPFITRLPIDVDSTLADILIDGEPKPFIGVQQRDTGDVVLLPFAMIFHLFWVDENVAAYDLISQTLNMQSTQRFDPMPRLDAVEISGGINQISADFIAEESGYVLFAMTYSPHWEAKVNGQPTEVVRHENMLAVRADKGENHLELDYRPTPIQWISLAISIASAVALGLVSFFGLRTTLFSGETILGVFRGLFVRIPSWIFQDSDIEQKKTDDKQN